MSTLEERKLVTVLFADVVASTQLAARLDPEQLRERMRRFFSIAREEIARYGGTVEKFIGDAVMAVFGLPAVHEDDPVRAVRAALAIRTRMQPEVQAGLLPEIRIGLTTGEVIADPQAAAQGEFLVTGEPVNLAARLQQHAAPGQILAGESTYAATEWAFTFRPLSPLAVKGIPDAVTAFECVGARAQPLPSRGMVVRGIRSSLVGRDEEFSILVQTADRLRSGQGGIVSVIGEAGLGKSRLIVEVRRYAEEAGLHWLEGHTLSFSQQISYWPFLEIIKSAAGIMEDDGEAESWAKLDMHLTALFPDDVAEILPYLATVLALPVRGELEKRVKYLDGEAMRRQIFRASRRYFERLARLRPLVLVVEDMHWIDESSALLLEHLLPLVETAPILACGISRPESETPAARLREVVLQAHAGCYTEIELAPLSPANAAQLVMNLLGADTLPPRAQELILQKTEGNPFFIEEVIRSLIDLKALARDQAGRWQATAQLERISIPDTLRGVIIARIDRLDEEVKQILKMAAVIGRSFFYRVLRAIAEAGEKLDESLSDLQQFELIREKKRVPELEFIFKHALTQEAAYESLLLRRRRELHRRVGETIEVLFADRLEEFYSLLAYHYARAEEWQQAQAYLFKAGDQAVKRAADAEALAHYRQAVAAYERVFGDRWDPLQRASLERRIGEALFRRGEHQSAIESLERALGYLGRSMPSSRWGVRLAIVWELTRRALRRALPGADPQPTDRPDPLGVELSGIYSVMGWIDYFINQERVLLECLQQLAICERRGHAVGIIRASMGLGMIYDVIPAHGLAGGYHRRAVALGEQVQNPLATGLAYIGMGYHQQTYAGHFDLALEYYQRGAKVHWEAGELREWAAATHLVAAVLRLQGEFDASLEHSRHIARIAEETGDRHALAWGMHGMGRTELHTGKLDGAVAYLQRAIELSTALPDYQTLASAKADLGECYRRQELLGEAIAALEESNHLVTSRDLRGIFRTEPRNYLAEAYLAAAEQDNDTEARAAMLSKAGRVCSDALRQGKVARHGLPAACRLKGTYEWSKGRRSDARKWWERSIREAEQLGGRYDLGMTHLEIGRRLGERAHLERAETIFRDIGAEFDLAMVRELLLGGQRARVVAG